MTRTKPTAVHAVTEAKRNATIPKRQVIQHTKLFRAELQAQLNKANNALLAADAALASAADDRDTDIALATKRFDAIRVEIDAERDDLARNIEGIEAALKATDDKPALSVVPVAAQ